MKSKQRILVLTLSFGSGHLQAARAVAKEVTVLAPNAEVRLIDALASCRRLFRAAYVWPYWAMLRNAPWLWGCLAKARVRQKHQSTAPPWAFRVGCPEVFRTIENFNPDVIVAVEVAACEMAVIARRLGITSSPILSVITDYESEPIWVKPEVEAFVVPDENARAELIAWGAAAKQVVMCGIPVEPSFDLIHDVEALRRRHWLDNDAPLVLVMGGGMGPTRMDQVARQLGETKLPMNIIAVAGRDRRTLRRLQRLRVNPPVSLRVLGWTDEVAPLMQAAAVLVTKPGGLTIAEAALCSLPTVFFDPIPGAELVNAKRMVDAGAALITKNARDTANSILALLHDERLLQALALKARGMARPAARTDIAQLALSLAGSPEQLEHKTTV
jgi:processive 1,2-diacylglycerol beta-glucosyltransferase